MHTSRLAALRWNPVALALAGVLGFSVAAILLKLPRRITRGERGQAAIQMLDAMRRPFLTIKEAEARLFEKVDVQASHEELSLAIGSAADLLERYTALARYNVLLSANVRDLSRAFQSWVAAERGFVGSLQVTSGPKAGAGPPTIGVMPGLSSAASGFLNTMSTLAAGELPIHADIADGRRATHLLEVLVLALLLYFVGLAFWVQRLKSKREAAVLRDRLHLEQKAHALEQTLGEALTKILSGFIPICASCKNIRGEDNQWTQIEAYVTKRTDAQFSHGICPGCAERLYGDVLSLKTQPASP